MSRKRSRKQDGDSGDSGGVIVLDEDPSAAVDRAFHPDAKRLKVGQWLSRISYIRIQDKESLGVIRVRNTYGNEWSIGSEIVEWECVSPDQFTETQRVSRTVLARKLHDAGQNIFKARFTKKDGTVRVLVGHLISREDLMGRAQVVDLQVDNKNNERQVDYRTLLELVLNGKHYVERTYSGPQFQSFE